MSSPSLARSLEAERLAHHTWPCREEAQFGEWMLRAADGYSRRANSALAIGVPVQGVEAALDHVERWFRSREIQPCVKVTPLASLAVIEAMDARGWTLATPSRVLRREADPIPDTPRDLDVSWSSKVSDPWFESLATWDAESLSAASHHRALLERMPDARFATLRRQGRVAGTLVASIDGDQAHLYDLVLDPALRGQGIGSSFLRQILSDLFRDGARSATLQVLESNTTARTLYDRTGFVDVHGYHYRVAPSGPGKASCGC